MSAVQWWWPEPGSTVETRGSKSQVFFIEMGGIFKSPYIFYFIIQWCENSAF